MYHPDVIDRRLWQAQKNLNFKLHRYSVGDSIDRQENIALHFEEDKLVKPLSHVQKEFILNELTLSNWDYRYWANRYAIINTKTAFLERINFWESQEIALKHIEIGELDAWKTGGDNLWVWLKARQLGATAVAQTIIGHRLFFLSNQRAAIASDKPNPSLELSRRIELLYDHLPPWMRPHRKFHVKGTEMVFDILNNSLIVGHGGKEGGGLAQGQSVNAFHLSELPDWDNFEQIDADFLPTVPIHPTSIGFAESTAKQRLDDFYELFTAAWSGRHSRFNALFIPWYAEEHTYVRTPPDGWKPSRIALRHAEKVERESPSYCHGRTIRLTPAQLHWYERTFFDYKSRGLLKIFFQEYASDHHEAFQHAGISLFPTEMMSEMRSQMKPMVAYDLVSTV